MWLREILSLKPAKWPIGRSIRMALGIATPLMIGLVSGHLTTCLWITLGVMMQSAGEGNGSYRSLFRITCIAAPIGALGYFAGNLNVLPSPVAIAILTSMAFLAGIINSYGAAYSKGTLQALLGASLAFGLSAKLGSDVSYLQVAALYLVGAIFYLLLLGIESLIDQRRPQRQMLANYLLTLSTLAETRAAATAHNIATCQEKARSAVIDNYELLYSVLIDSRAANPVRSKENANNANILQAADSMCSAILASNDKQTLQIIAIWLRQVAQAILHKNALPELSARLSPKDPVILRANRLADSIQFLDIIVVRASRHFNVLFNVSRLWQKRHETLNHLIVGKSVLKAAAILALCMGIAFSMKYVVTGNHWYWIPLTVALVMKPELGSVFVRAVLRFTGTAIGVMIGALILMFVPKGFGLLIILIVLASFLPWATLRSYALQTMFLTPLVLILIDLMSPGIHNIDYAGQRIVDTAIGGAIVLIFGYFIWPRSHEKELASSYKNAMQTLATYFKSACTVTNTSTLQDARHNVYSQLSNLRAQVQRQMSEPPPSDREALKWFPIITGAERLADYITIYAEKLTDQTSLPTKEQVDLITHQLQSIVDASTLEPIPDNNGIHDVFLDEVTSELTNIAKLIHTKTI